MNTGVAARSWPITINGAAETVAIFHRDAIAMIAITGCADLTAGEARNLAEILSAAAHVAEDTAPARSNSWAITIDGEAETVHTFTSLTDDRSPMIAISGFGDLTIREARHLAGILCAAAHAAGATGAAAPRRGRGRAPVLSHGDRRQALALHQSGRPVTGIAAQFGVSPTVIRRLLREPPQ